MGPIIRANIVFVRPCHRYRIDLAMNHNMKVHADSETLAAAAARHIVDTLSKVLESRDRASLVLTGGSTPRLTYTVLAERSEEHTSELQSRGHLVCRLLLEKKNVDLALAR